MDRHNVCYSECLGAGFLTPVSAFSTYSLMNHCRFLLDTRLQGYENAFPLPCNRDNLPETKRLRGEKRPIPDDQKDDKYFERRRRNNQAAKKSRDARKFKEDQVAVRVKFLEHENAILRAQVITLREEATSLRRMLLQRGETELSPGVHQIYVS